MGIQYGYARVSSREQKLDRQLTALSDVGILKNHIYADKLSGKNFNRPGYRKLLKKLKEGDALFIKAIDRLGRNYDEILEQWRYLTRSRNVDIVVLDFPLLDTRVSRHGLTGKFIADLTLQILSYVAQMEREATHQRQMEGILEAKKRGVKFGRPQAVCPEEYAEIAGAIRRREISLREGARRLGTSHTMLRNWMRRELQMELFGGSI